MAGGRLHRGWVSLAEAECGCLKPARAGGSFAPAGPSGISRLSSPATSRLGQHRSSSAQKYYRPTRRAADDFAHEYLVHVRIIRYDPHNLGTTRTHGKSGIP